MSYTREEIIEMRRDGEITPSQAERMLAKLNEAEAEKKQQAEPPPPPAAEVGKGLAAELRRLAAAVEQAARKNGATVAEVSKIVQASHGSGSWALEFRRDDRGLIVSPIILHRREGAR